jgi:DNA polymerase-3 subunit epsilon
MRQVVLDTETTGLEASRGHRIIEIGCVEIVNRRITGRTFHSYVQPDRDIDLGAVEVHGITAEFLADKPRFADIASRLLDFVRDAELIIHNASFDVGFIDAELAAIAAGCIRDTCAVLDTLELARRLHPGQKNSLDALCKRYNVDNSNREVHGALLDARLLADVYLAMTGGQVSLLLMDDAGMAQGAAHVAMRPLGERRPLRIIAAGPEELAAHAAHLQAINKSSGGRCLWLRPMS